MAQPLETVLIKCPICSNEVKDIPINNEEMLEMCTNTKVNFFLNFNKQKTIILF